MTQCQIVDQDQRIQWIDLIRVIAIICVILCHSCESVYQSLSLEVINSLGILERMFVLGLFSIGRTGVPILLMITGYLLLDREYDKK